MKILVASKKQRFIFPSRCMSITGLLGLSSLNHPYNHLCSEAHADGAAAPWSIANWWVRGKVKHAYTHACS